LKYTALKALNRSTEAKSALLSVIERDPKFLPALLALTELAIQERDLQKANEYLNAAENIADNNIYNKILRADISSLKGDFNTSLKLYHDAFSEKPSNAIATKILHSYLKLGNNSGAIQFITSALESQPDNAGLFSVLGGLHLKDNNNQAAITAYQKSIDIEHNNPVILNNLAWLLKDTDLGQAKKYAEKALSLAPNSAEIKDTMDTIKQLE
jgi:tetratricopeptide (TPR) repeat protein